MIEHIPDGTLALETIEIADRHLRCVRIDSPLHTNELFLPWHLIEDWYSRQLTREFIRCALRPEFLRYYAGRLWISVIALDLLNKLCWVQGENNESV